MLPSRKGFPGGSVVKNLSANAGDAGDSGSISKIPWRRKWQPTPAFLPGRSHGQRRLAGYNPRGSRVGHSLLTEHTRMPSGNMKSSTSTFCLLDLFFLAVPGLSCHTWDLRSSLWHAGSLVSHEKLCMPEGSRMIYKMC